MCVAPLVQRFNQSNVLKRTIFELIAQELINVHASNNATPEATAHDGETAGGAARSASSSCPSESKT